MGEKLYLYVFCDALGWEIDKHRPVAPDVLPHRYPLGTIFGYSSTCDPTILTGRLPRDHGHFSCFFYNPKFTPFKSLRWLNLVPAFVRERARTRRIVSRWLRKKLGYTGYFQLYNMPFPLLKFFDYSEKYDIYKPGGILSGAETIFQAWQKAGLKSHVSNWNLPESERVGQARAAIASGEVDCVYLYMADLDAVLHRSGPTGDEVPGALDGYASILRELHDLAHEKYRTVSMHLFSDHGMTQVKGTADVMGMVERSGLKFGKDYVAVYDSTMARFWYLNDKAKTGIEQALASCHEGRWVGADELAGYGCDFAHATYGDGYFLMNPGVLLCPSFMGLRPIPGMHGYDPLDKDSIALYATNDPNVNPPKRLEELYALMSEPCKVST